MANEAPKIDWGWGVSGFDARNSSITGTTRAGLNGSGQFLAVSLSTSVAGTVNLSTVAGNAGLGILQNKPSTGIAPDVTVFGFSKAMAGASIDPGQEVMNSSTAPGSLIPVTTGLYAMGRNVGAAAVVGQLFSMYVYGAPRLTP